MRNIPPALQTHIDGEVLSLTRCLKITKTDGTVVRLTTHDIDLTVSGDIYNSGIPLDISAIESTDTLAVDNAEIEVGIDGTLIVEDELNAGLYDNAAFELFIVNWENTGDGQIFLKRGTLGDITITSGLFAKIELRGLTQALQRPIVERYSPTCRVSLGGKKCGVVNTPNRIRRTNAKVRTFDWFLVPSANITTPTISNLGFEDLTPLAGWTIPPGSAFSRDSGFASFEGTAHALGGAGTQGSEMVMYRDLDTATIGMADVDVDAGKFSLDFTAQIAATSAVIINSGKLFVEQFNALGQTLRRDETDPIIPDFESWEGIGLTPFIVPNCRTIRIGFINRLDNGGAGSIAFDAAEVRFWTNEASTWNSTVFRTVKIPAYAQGERLSLGNTSFETDGAVANTNTQTNISAWTFAATDYWAVEATHGGLAAYSGNYSLYGGDDSSNTPHSIYTMTQDLSLAADALGSQASAANITAGWYYCELQAQVAMTDADSSPKITLSFLDSIGSVISSVTSGFLTSLVTDTWTYQSIGGRVPSGTSSIRVTLDAQSGVAGSAANVGFDDIRLIFVPTAYEHDDDAEIGKLGSTLPTYDYTQLNYTKDGQVVVQAQTPVFGYAALTAVTDQRVFSATAISATAESLYSGKIVWLSGNNAGRTSFIRIWDDTSKQMKIYDTLVGTVQVGDKFVYAKGCDKTIDICADTFGNAHNFRGEPYLPGPNKVIEFLTTS